MRLKQSITLMLLFLLFAAQTEITAGTQMTIKFVALGNCGQCKDRIEAAINTIEGISYAYWDYSLDEATVTYDMSLSDPHTIIQTVADTGHDTEWYPAPLAAYNLLVGTCCEYTRTIDYAQAQVGYLSLMGIWANQLSVVEITEKGSISVFPTVSNDFINVKSDLQLANLNLDIYSISGKKILTQKLTAKNETIIDISSLTIGSYIFIVNDKKRVLSRTNIIKQ